MSTFDALKVYAESLEHDFQWAKRNGTKKIESTCDEKPLIAPMFQENPSFVVDIKTCLEQGKIL